MGRNGQSDIDGHERRDEKIAFRLTLSEKTFLEKQAHNAGMNLAAYARQIILGVRIPQPSAKVDAEVLHELNRIGVIFNQLATTRLPGCNPDEVESLLCDFRDTLKKVGNAYGP